MYWGCEVIAEADFVGQHTVADAKQKIQQNQNVQRHLDEQYITRVSQHFRELFSCFLSDCLLKVDLFMRFVS